MIGYLLAQAHQIGDAGRLPLHSENLNVHLPERLVAIPGVHLHTFIQADWQPSSRPQDLVLPL